MALPEYFERNAEAVGTLIKGFDLTAFAKRLEPEVIGIFVDACVATAEGRACVDLLVRLTARIYPTLVIAGTRAASASVSELHELARDINPKIDVTDEIAQATRLLVIGSTEPPPATKATNATWYIGSDNWFVRLSRTAAVGCGLSENPLGAGAAACVGAANVFRSIFAGELGDDLTDTQVNFSLLDMRTVDGGSVNPAVGTLALPDVHLVGAGAIGHGFLWAMARLAWRGTLHVVDPEAITDSNLQRYVLATAKDRDKQKAVMVRRWIKASKGRKLVLHGCDWATHIATVPAHKVDIAISALDSANARIALQASLPRRIFNAWTQNGEAGVSRHGFLGDMACLACMYLPQKKTLNEDQLITGALKLPETEPMIKEVRRRLQLAVPTERAFLELIANVSGVALQKLLTFENQPLRELYTRGICGGALIEFHAEAIAAKAEVPMAFQSAFSGILLAAELARPEQLAHVVTQIDLLNTFPDAPGRNAAKTQMPPCICVDEDFVDAYRAKYSVEGA
jgi:molybdopterin/thiamine biosynthesis adenylyltransferase